MTRNLYVTRVALTVALGGFLMGFDASVISGVVGFIETEFTLSSLELGWAVSSLTLTSTLAMMLAGPLSDRIGRRAVLFLAAVLYGISAVASALAPSFAFLVVARMIGGLGVGASLIIAPMYIAEIAPPRVRGRMVSFNQLNIVVGISAAFFANYLILRAAQGDAAWARALGMDAFPWRWMLGVETLPAVLYFAGLFFVPASPRWLLLQGREAEAGVILGRAVGQAEATEELREIRASLAEDADAPRGSVRDLFAPAMRLVLTIGVVLAVLQQITGINSVFFYAPRIFEQTGIGTDAAFAQAVLVGLTNLVFTLVAMALIDRVGRKPLLNFGLAGITVSMFLLAYGFSAGSDALDPWLILAGILGFVASFAVSVGPVMWVLFSELFPNRIRGIAISFVGLINSAVSFGVQLIFPWELDTLGSALTFLIYGMFAAAGLVFVWRVVPETKGRSLEALESMLVGGAAGR